MTTRGKVLAAAAAVAVLVAVILLTRPSDPGGPRGRRPERLETTLTFDDAGGACDKKDYPELLRADATKNRQLTWNIHNNCDVAITVCLNDFEFETDVSGPDRSPLQNPPPNCANNVQANTTNRTIRENVRGDAPEGIFQYEIYLTVSGGEKKKVDPVIDIIR